MALFTAETAVIAAKLSHAPTSARHQPKEEIKPAPPEPQPAPMPAGKEASEDLKRVKGKLDKLDALMDKAKTPQEWDQLSRAYDRMFKAWMVLSATPLPGSLKQTGKPNRPSPQVEPAPIETPQAVVSDVPPSVQPE